MTTAPRDSQPQSAAALELPGVRVRFETRVSLAVVAGALVPAGALLALGQGPTPVGIVLLSAAPAVWLSWFVARRIARRVRLLAVATARVGQGDLAVRVRPRGNDEVDALMRAFNAMVEDMQVSRSRIEYLQRIGAWQDLAQKLAHEIKNPLTPIQLAIQEVAKKYPGGDADFARTLATAHDVIKEEVETLRTLVAAFSEFARLPDVKVVPGDLAEFVRDAGESRAFLDEAASGLPSRSEVRVVFDAPADAIPVRLDRILMRRVVDNLVRNAVQAGARTVWVRAERRPDCAWLVVEDDGPGVPAPARARIFEPYFTTKPEGTGLGLPIVRKIAIDHAGDVGYEARAGGGAQFIVTLPLELQAGERRLSFVTFNGSARAPDGTRAATLDIERR